MIRATRWHSGPPRRVSTHQSQSLPQWAQACPLLADAGVPVPVALRAMAAAVNAIALSRGRAVFAVDWPAEHLALAFLCGALKAEWVGGEDKAPCKVSTLEARLSALKLRFGFAQKHHAKMALAFDCVFCDTDLTDCGGEP